MSEYIGIRDRLDTVFTRLKPLLDQSLPIVLIGVLCLVVFQFAFPLNARVQQFLNYANWAVIAFFVVRLVVDYRLTEEDESFLRNHWMDIVMVLPVFSVLKEARALQLLEEIPAVAALQEEAVAATVARNTGAAAKVTKMLRLIKRSF